MKAEIQPTTAPPEPKTLAALLPDQRDPRAEVARAALTTHEES